MRLRYEDAAKAALLDMIRFGIENDLPDPVAFVRGLRARFEHMATIKHPGRKGRVPGTREWVVPGSPYIAVFQVEGDVVRILHVLHGAQQWPPAP